MPFTPTETEVTEAETARKAEYRKILNARRKREGIAEDAMKKEPEYASIYDAFFGRKLKPLSLSTEQISLLVTVVVALGTALAGYLKSKSLATRAEKAATTAEGHALSAKESAESVE